MEKTVTLLVDLLAAVRTGKLEFFPQDESETSLREFELPAKALFYAEEEKLIGRISPHKNALYGEWLYDMLIVAEGLTYRGEMYLADPEPQKERQLEDILELRPNFMGLGINLNALWRKYFGK